MSVILSKEYGLNPSVERCSCCGESMSVLLLGTAYEDENGKTAKAPHQMMTGNICDKCNQVIKNGGTFFIEVRNGEAAKQMFNNCQAINYMEQDLFSRCFGEFVNEE